MRPRRPTTSAPPPPASPPLRARAGVRVRAPAARRACREVGDVAGLGSSRAREDPAGTRPRDPAATSASPEWRATSGGQRRPPRPRRRPSRTPRGRSRARPATSASGSRWTRWRCSSGPGEERPRPARCASSSSPVVAEADDDRPRVERRERLEQHLDALVLDQLPEVDDRRRARRRRSARAARRCPRPGAAPRRCRGSAGRRRASSSSAASASLARLRAELVDVDAGRHLVDAVDVADDLLEHSRMCSEPTKTASARASASAPHASSSGPPAHRVLELRPVRLDARSARRSRRRPAPPSSTWFAKTRSAGRSSRSAAAFASTYASRSAGVKSCSSRASRPS